MQPCSPSSERRTKGIAARPWPCGSVSEMRCTSRGHSTASRRGQGLQVGAACGTAGSAENVCKTSPPPQQPSVKDQLPTPAHCSAQFVRHLQRVGVTVKILGVKVHAVPVHIALRVCGETVQGNGASANKGANAIAQEALQNTCLSRPASTPPSRSPQPLPSTTLHSHTPRRPTPTHTLPQACTAQGAAHPCRRGRASPPTCRPWAAWWWASAA